MKTLLSTIAFCLVFNCGLFGQSIHNNSSVIVSGDSAIVRIETDFGWRPGGGGCFPLELASITTAGNNYVLNLFYRLTAGLNDFGCTSIDTFYITGLTANNNYSLQVFANVIQGSDTMYSNNPKNFTFALLTSQSASLSQTISLYPNPTTEAVTINFNGVTAENRTVEIMDLYGRLIRKVIVDPARTEISIPVTELPAGLYFCIVGDGNKARQFRFVKQ